MNTPSMSDDMLIPLSGPIDAVIRPPGSKSITNRALMVAAFADGVSTLRGALESDDTEAMREALGKLGIVVESTEGIWSVHGGPLGNTDEVLDVRASGTTARFLTAALTLANGDHQLDGTARMRERPIAPQADGLNALGANVEVIGVNGCPPVVVRGPALAGGSVEMDASQSSQFVSAIMLVAPMADDDTEISFIDDVVISRPYLVTTQEVMQAFGADVTLADSSISIAAKPYQPRDYEIEVDASAAVYPWVAAAITGGSVLVEGIAGASTQADVGVLDVLEAMGCSVDRAADSVRVSGPKRLSAVDVDMNSCPDGVLGVAVAAMFADGPSTIRNVASLRVKETDRLDALQAEIRRLGAEVTTGPDWITIVPQSLSGATIRTYDDHRMAMSFALAGLRVPNVRISDPGCVAKTWPTFFDALFEMVRPAVIAIDGPGGSGKTSVSRAVSQRLGLPHLDTGAYYRAATIAVLDRGVAKDDEVEVVAAVKRSVLDYENGVMLLDGRDVSVEIRSEAVTNAVSAVSAYPEVREQMVAAQRAWVTRRGGAAVVEGRDIGTAVFPDAPIKFYLTARPEVRAARRAQETDATPEDIAKDLVRRDTADSQRAVSPLAQADDAVVVDTSDLSIYEVIAELSEQAAGALGL